jgi:hypothetical protein
VQRCCRDLDEASIDSLYANAKRDSLPILPLVVNLSRRSQIVPRWNSTMSLRFPALAEKTRSILHQPARLQCDMVLALAVIHHLALGQGHSFDRIASIVFDPGQENIFCAEFVGIDDPMITSDRSFFPAYNSAPNDFGWYSLDNFIAAVRRHFPSVEIRPSHPGTERLSSSPNESQRHNLYA